MFAHPRRRHLWASDPRSQMPLPPAIVRHAARVVHVTVPSRTAASAASDTQSVNAANQDQPLQQSSSTSLAAQWNRQGQWHESTAQPAASHTETSSAAAYATVTSSCNGNVIGNGRDTSAVAHSGSPAPTHVSRHDVPINDRKVWPCRVCTALLSTSSNRKRHERAKHPLSDAARLDGRFVHPHFDSRIPEPGEELEDLPPPGPRLLSQTVTSTEAGPTPGPVTQDQSQPRSQTSSSHAKRKMQDAWPVSIGIHGSNSGSGSLTKSAASQSPSHSLRSDSESETHSFKRSRGNDCSNQPTAAAAAGTCKPSEASESDVMMVIDSAHVTETESHRRMDRESDHVQNDRVQQPSTSTAQDHELDTSSDDGDYSETSESTSCDNHLVSDATSRSDSVDSGSEDGSSMESSVLSDSESDSDSSSDSSNSHVSTVTSQSARRRDSTSGRSDCGITSSESDSESEDRSIIAAATMHVSSRASGRASSKEFSESGRPGPMNTHTRNVTPGASADASGPRGLNWTELSSLPGAPRSLAPGDFQSTCEPFMTWLAQPPITQSEAMVKARRVRNPSQVIPIRNNLRFLLVTLHEQLQDFASTDRRDHPDRYAGHGTSSHLAAAGVPQLDAFTHLDVCQRLFDLMIKRQIGSARVHALFLLIKKVLVYLSSVASLENRQYIAPVTFPSFFYVDSICADASLQRKQEARNRSLLGMQASPFQPHAHVQVQWDGTVHGARTGHGLTPSNIPSLKLPTVQEENQVLGPVTSSRSALSPSVAAPPRVHQRAEAATSTPPIANRIGAVRQAETLTKADLQKLASGCLSQLLECQKQINSMTHVRVETGTISLAKTARKQYVKYLATATLCLGLAPRSQVLRELQLGTTLVKNANDGRYWVKMLAELNKNGKPCMMAFPAELTQPYDYYFEHVRPQLLAEATCSTIASGAAHAAPARLGTASGPRCHAYVFFKRDGQAPRPEFSTWTNAVTVQLLGRPINAHAFRAGVITTFYENGASQSEMDVLASLMAHDSATAKTHYFRPQFAQAAVRTNDQMTRLLLPDRADQVIPLRPASAAASATTAAAPASAAACSMMDTTE